VPGSGHSSSVLQRVRDALRLTAESLFTTLFPADCRLCQEPLTAVSRLPVCNPCLEKIKAFDAPQCAVCGELLPSRGPIVAHNLQVASDTCVGCQKARPMFQKAIAFGPYEGAWRDLIHLLKYQRVRPAAQVIGKALAEQIANAVIESALVVPVPLHRSKFHIRGFNQAEEIARVIRKLGKYEWSTHALVRRRATASQTGMTPLQRRDNVRGAFAVRKRYQRDITGRNIILVDDVYTTGATANECARVLRRAGAANVWVATAARVTKMYTGMNVGARIEMFGLENVADRGQATGTHAGD
jgi:ComF family protein